eukprot:1153263-Pelagomonas_calceolata.AAC.2
MPPMLPNFVQYATARANYTLTLACITLCCAHWMACIFYFIARAEGFTSNSWAGAVDTMVEAEPWGRIAMGTAVACQNSKVKTMVDADPWGSLRFAEKLASGGAVCCLEAVLHPFWQKKGVACWWGDPWDGCASRCRKWHCFATAASPGKLIISSGGG